MGNVQRMRRILAVLGAVAAVVAAAGIAAHYIGLVNTMVARIASFTPLFVILAMVAVLMLSAARQRVRTVLAVVIAVVGVWSQIPLFTRTDTGQPATDSVSVRLLQANIRLGEADVGALMQTVIDEDVDVLTVIELTPEALQRLSPAGITETLPYSFVRPGSSGSGAGIFARFPLTDGRRLKGFAPNNLEAVMALPGVGPVGVYALHPIPPYPEPSYKWAQELRLLRSVFAAQTHPLIVGADFNSTYDHWQYRDLLANSSTGPDRPLIDAGEFLGSGFVPTFPADRWYPSLLAIDKILTRGGTPLSFRRVDLPGSDHRGVLGDIRFDAA